MFYSWWCYIVYCWEDGSFDVDVIGFMNVSISVLVSDIYENKNKK